MSADREASLEQAAQWMLGFAERTGLVSDGPGPRYLWTDAFAVCNFLELERATGEERYGQLALRLVDRVHHTLGRHRPGETRHGWLSGLPEAAGESHPTRAGLRIGKRLPERGLNEPPDEHLEWERDGQYFHYLTRWMHALDRVSAWSGQQQYNLWARELAEAAHSAFVYVHPLTCSPRMYWKMSIDLSRPLVASMGHHDALDGLITCVELQTSAAQLAGPAEPSLSRQVSDFAAMIQSRALATEDPLGLGGLLMDSCRVTQLMRHGAFSDGELLVALLAAALEGLRQCSTGDDLAEPAWRRLAFRELGLAIGLSALDVMTPLVTHHRARTLVERLSAHRQLGSDITDFWLRVESRESRTWSEHRDINEVMLATSLAPRAMLVAGPA